MSYGLVFHDAYGVERVRIGCMDNPIRIKEKALIDIPNWPPYKVRSPDLQVISFHSSRSGYELKKLKANSLYDRNEDGFNLYYKGKRGFIGLSELREIVELNEKGNKMQYASERNLKSGDIIIGSQLKSGGAVSFSANPVIQTSMIVAKHEAARLANVDKTKRFLVCKIEAVASTVDVVWE